MRVSDEEWAASGLGPVLDDWWADYARSLRRRGRTDETIGAYRRAFVRFWRFAHGHGIELQPGAVDYRTVNAWTDDLGEDVAPATVAILWRNVRPFFSWWARETDEMNPFARADVPSVPETLIPVVALDDIRRLLATCSGKAFDDRRDNAVIRVLVDCGIRLGELVNLGVGDWDRRADLLFVTGKSGPRVVPHGPATGEAISRYLRIRAGHPKAAVDSLWLGKKGAWGISGPQQMLVRRCREAGLPRLHAHQFRHTWAHEAKSAGLGEGDLMALAGWKTAPMAQRYGSSAAAERARNAYRPLSLGERL